MRTWKDAADAWLVDKHYKSSLYQDAAKIEWLSPRWDRLALTEIDRERVMAVGRVKAAEASPATANRYLALIRSILRRALHVWRWIDVVPHIELFPEPGRRVRWLRPSQVVTLLHHLPDHQRLTVVFALATGLRQSNVLRLEWPQVDLRRRMLWVHADQAKGRRDFSISLNQTAVDVLKLCRGAHKLRVFTYQGRPFVSANTRAWRHALCRAGIRDFRWHDLRHTWASWHVQHGTPLFVVQDLGAWSSEQMVRRYAHLAPSQYAEHAHTIDDVMKAVKTFRRPNDTNE